MTMQQRYGSGLPFSKHPVMAVAISFIALLAILICDILSPTEYRLVSVYILPVVIIALNTEDMTAIVIAFLLASACQSYLTLEEHDFKIVFTAADFFNFAIRFLTLALIVWLARNLRKSQLAINNLANTDALTGLSNRRWARIILEQSIARLNEDKVPFAVALIDLNNFKKINDTYGHLAGDAVLVRLASVFAKNIADGVEYFRLGGDEFLIVMASADGGWIKRFLEHISMDFDQEMRDLAYPVSLSIGMVAYKESPNSASDILHEADMRMYEKKVELNLRDITTQNTAQNA
jgi:diguanylate cyclase (GGDEF)-like protein